MKKVLLAVALIAVFVSGCKVIDDALTFEVDYTSSFTIQSGIATNTPISIQTPPVTTSSEDKFDNNNTSKDKIKQIKLKKLKLTITSPSGETFSFLESIKLYIDTEGQDEVLMAFKNDIPDSVGGTLELDVTGEELDAYVKADSFSIRTEAVTDEFFSPDVEVDADMTFQVTADPL